MSQTMFARAAASKSNLDLYTVLLVLALVIGGFLEGSAAPERGHDADLRASNPAASAVQNS
jgi:hypothetical protein